MTTSQRAPLLPVTGSTQKTRPSNNAYFPALDGLRAIAVLMVFGNHYLNLPWGWAGVDVFFVLSGFLITGILFDTQDAPDRVYNFYLRRTLRIFPLYYGVFLVLLLITPLIHWQWNWTWLVWPAYIGNFARYFAPAAPGSPLSAMSDGHLLSPTFHYLQLNLGHFWSLCVEEQFYLVWPCVVFWVRDRRRLICVCAAFVCICPFARFWANHTLPQWMIQAELAYRATPLRIDALLLGGFIALARRGPYAKQLLLIAKIGLALIFVAAVAWFALHPAAWHRPTVYPVWTTTWGYTLIDSFTACLILTMIEYGSITFHIFNLRPLRWLGRISYGAYVFHDMFHPELYRVARYFTPTHATLLTAAIALPATFVISWASFRWFETPFIDLKERWTRRQPAPLN